MYCAENRLRRGSVLAVPAGRSGSLPPGGHTGQQGPFDDTIMARQRQGYLLVEQAQQVLVLLRQGVACGEILALVLQCQLERELIRYVKRYLCQPQVTIITNDKQFAFMCELYDYVENTELPPEMVSSLMKTKNVLELSWDEWLMNAEVEDMEDSIEKVAELLRKGKI